MADEASRFTAEDIEFISTSGTLSTEEVDELVRKSKERVKKAQGTV
jgi:hypothetical protein